MLRYQKVRWLQEYGENGVKVKMQSLLVAVIITIEICILMERECEMNKVNVHEDCRKGLPTREEVGHVTNVESHKGMGLR